jgi:catechol 2,3-dioxygenase-like lactoylglutathione lyase family enzyme
MSDARPVLDQINVVTGDFAASLAFYRLLGVTMPEEGVFKKNGSAHHVNAVKEAGAQLDLDSTAFAQVWTSGWAGREDLSGRVLVTFRFETRAGVDERYGELTRAGYRSLHSPCDAFWGVRFAAVEDPSGLAVGLMSPAEVSRRARPPEF